MTEYCAEYIEGLERLAARMAQELEKTSSLLISDIPDLTTPSVAYKANRELVEEYFMFRRMNEND